MTTNIDPIDPDWPNEPHLDPEDDPETLAEMMRQEQKRKFSFDQQDNNPADPEQADWSDMKGGDCA